MHADGEGDQQLLASETHAAMSDSKEESSERCTRPFKSPLFTEGGKMIMTGKTFQVRCVACGCSAAPEAHARFLHAPCACKHHTCTTALHLWRMQATRMHDSAARQLVWYQLSRAVLTGARAEPAEHQL